jgi:transposase-like protein
VRRCGRALDRAPLGDEAVARTGESASLSQAPGRQELGYDETYIKLKGQWKYLYRAVDKAGNTVDFLLRAHRDKTAARRYFEKSIDQNGAPDTVTIDRSGANLAALEAINADREVPIKIRQSKYLNNLVEQDHRAIKRRTRPMLGFKSFRCARILLAGIELMYMVAKGQMQCPRGPHRSDADQFYDLAI